MSTKQIEYTGPFIINMLDSDEGYLDKNTLYHLEQHLNTGSFFWQDWFNQLHYNTVIHLNNTLNQATIDILYVKIKCYDDGKYRYIISEKTKFSIRCDKCNRIITEITPQKIKIGISKKPWVNKKCNICGQGKNILSRFINYFKNNLLKAL